MPVYCLFINNDLFIIAYRRHLKKQLNIGDNDGYAIAAYD